MIILWYLFFSLLITFRKRTNILTCGIWAWSGSNVSLFNADKFNILGMFNDSRGGDASGKFLDRKLYRGIEKSALYKDLIKNYPTVCVKENTVAIGHARKASVGSKTIPNTQPFYILDINDPKKYLGVFMHNGTINNISELCKKYKVPYDSSLSDSFHLGLLLFNVGTHILGEYNGTAACMWIDWKNRNNLFVFKGESKYTKSGVSVEERPLYIYKQIGEKGNSIWLSSTKESLESALQVNSKDPNPVEDLETNVIYKITKDKVYKIKEIDRTNIVQETTTYSGYNYANSYANSYANTNSRTITNINLKRYNWINEEIPETNDNIIRFFRGRYHVGNKLANGEIKLLQSGYIDNEKGKSFFFIQGVLLKDRVSYIKAIKEISPVYPHNNFWENILEYTDCPVARYFEEGDTVNGWTKIYDIPSPHYNSSMKGKYFTGTFSPLFSNKTYLFSVGDCTTIEEGIYNSYEEDDSEQFAEYIPDICENYIDDAIEGINKAIKDIEEIEPKIERIIAPYIEILEDAKDVIYEGSLKDNPKEIKEND